MDSWTRNLPEVRGKRGAQRKREREKGAVGDVINVYVTLAMHASSFKPTKRGLLVEGVGRVGKRTI